MDYLSDTDGDVGSGDGEFLHGGGVYTLSSSTRCHRACCPTPPGKAKAFLKR